MVVATALGARIATALVTTTRPKRLPPQRLELVPSHRAVLVAAIARFLRLNPAMSLVSWTWVNVGGFSFPPPNFSTR
jgi:hypothetical protein